MRPRISIIGCVRRLVGWLRIHQKQQNQAFFSTENSSDPVKGAYI